MRKRQPGTGQWLIESELFGNWEASSKQTLFCEGIPGAGKTIQSAIVIDYLQSKFHHQSDDVGIAFIFCNYQPQQKQRPEVLLLSLCKQLISSRSGNVPSSILELYQQLLKKESRPTVQQAYSVLEWISNHYTRLYIVLDALDEYYESDATGHGIFISHILKLQSNTSMNIFATSRHNHKIASLFNQVTSIEILATATDIMSFVDS